MTVSAALADTDVQGRMINNIIDDFIFDWYNEWQVDRQCSDNQDTLIFIDSQLLEFNFLERLCNFFGKSYDVNGLQFIYGVERMRFLVHNGGDVYADVTRYALTGDATNCIYDFSDPVVRNELSSMVGQVSMCALAIYHFELCMFDFFESLQLEWYGDFKVYVIERDQIFQTTSLLQLEIYNSVGRYFGVHSNAGGGGAWN